MIDPSAVDFCGAATGKAVAFSLVDFCGTSFLAAGPAAAFTTAFFAGIAFRALFLAGAALVCAADVGSGFAAAFLAGAVVFFAAGFVPKIFFAATFATVGPLFFAESVFFCLAHRARCAAAIRSLPAADIVRRFGANSSGLKLVALFVEPLGRPRRFASLGFAEGA